MIIKTDEQTLVLQYSNLLGGWNIIAITHAVEGLTDKVYDTRADALLAIAEREKVTA